ncbi:hypothetical protein L226DRAFT_427621, partial [Lentinus tigrinus ALCF2SS1-7]
MLVWIESALTPQEVRDCIMDSESDFQRKMVEYLKSVHKGEFLNGDMESKVKDPFQTPPTETLPEVPPIPCEHTTRPDCDACKNYQAWWQRYAQEVDEILLLSDVHKCTTRNKNGKTPK